MKEKNRNRKSLDWQFCQHILCILLFVSAAQAFCQDGTFTASVSDTKVAAGEQFVLSFTFSGSDVNGIKNFRPPDFGQFVVLSGPNQSTNMQWVNGQMSASITYTYNLYARQTGKFTIGAAAIEYKGRTLKSDPINVEVVQAKPQSKGQQKKDEEAGAINVGDNLFIRAVADKQRVRVGEQLTVTFKLYTRVSISTFDLKKAPTFEGFWSEDFEQPKQPTLTNETVDGKQYRVAVIKKTALFATQAGNLKIAPLEVQCAVQVQSRRRSNDPFDAFFSDPFFQQVQTVNLDFKSNPLTITVDPIPANAPSGFSGAIGRYNFAATVDKRTVKAGDPITLKLSVSGTGNIKLVTIPKPILPADMESYEPKISEDISREGGVIRGKKSAEYLLILRNQGMRVIEPITFAYYDLDKREYVTYRSPRFEFTILPGKDFSTSGFSVAAKEDVRLLGEDIRFLKLTPGDVQNIAESSSTSNGFIFGIVIPPLLFIGAWLYRRRMEKVYGDMPRLLFEKAGREASRRLKTARALLEEGNTERFYAEVHRALVDYLEHKLQISKAEFTMEDAVNQMKQRSISEEAIVRMKECVERAEFARYAPAADTTAARKEILNAATEAINGIEQNFGKPNRQLRQQGGAQ